MSGKLEGKVALVTGSTTGIGRGIAHRLASDGCSLVLTGLATESEIQALVEEFKTQYQGRQFCFVPGDFLVTEKTEQFCLDVLSVYPDGVDILVNNAGLASRGSIESLTTEVWLNSLAVNLTAPFLLTRAFFPHMKRKGWGRIINMASQMAQIAEPGKVAYCTPKAGLVGMAKVVALEGASHGVTCNAVCPGYVDAPMCHSMFEAKAAATGVTFDQCKTEFAASNTPSGRLVPISEVAGLVAFLCSDEAASISGSPLFIDSGNVIR